MLTIVRLSRNGEVPSSSEATLKDCEYLHSFILRGVTFPLEGELGGSMPVWNTGFEARQGFNSLYYLLQSIILNEIINSN